MFRFDIRGFRCNKETDGRGSDEVGFFLAALPVLPTSNAANIQYSDSDNREFRIRWASEIDTGETAPFEYPIGVKEDQVGNDGDWIQIIIIMFEIDGAGSTKNQAIEEHDIWRDTIIRECRPGIQFQDVWRRVLPWVGYDSQGSFVSGDAFGYGEDIIAMDVWYVNPQVLEGTVEFDGFDGPAVGQGTFGIVRDLYKNRRGDGSLSETRSYHSSQEGSRYTFEVEYTNT